MNRRSFILGALAAPAVITTPGLLMPVKALPVDGRGFFFWSRAVRYPMSTHMLRPSDIIDSVAQSEDYLGWGVVHHWSHT